jgi:cyclohexyl-isocyanide hydratase
MAVKEVVMTEPFSIVFALYPGITQLDFTGPFEVLRRAPDTRVVAASLGGGELTADSGLTFAGLLKLSEIAACDLICVPGGYGQAAAARDAQFLAEVRRLAQGARYVTSVCTGSLILAAAGLIAIPDAGRVVRDGNVISGGGVTAGIDFALTVVAELRGAAVAQAIQLGIEYDPEPPFDAGRPESAPAEVLQMVRKRIAGLYPERKAAMEAALSRS